jgi:hypothetical protein
VIEARKNASRTKIASAASTVTIMIDVPPELLFFVAAL